ncbi:MAG: AmmeMemoRadiSam system protein B [Bacteroidetes bacterium]|nr:AmmeMemoRadiSam system protein B [Bacteroidota bacterium]
MVGSEAGEAAHSYMIPARTSAHASDPSALESQIRGLLSESRVTPVDFRVLSVIVPNSDHQGGAPLAADVFRSLPADLHTIVISVAPNRGDEFKRISICSLDHYDTPLGGVRINDAIRNELCDEDDDIYIDDRGHFQDQGLDVSLPFLQQVLSDFDVVPLVMGSESPDFCRELGSAVGEIMANQRTLLVASMDILEATESGLERFREYLTTLNVSSMQALIQQESEIRVQGKGPLIVAMLAAAHRRANQVVMRGLEGPDADRPGFAGALIGRI